MDAKRLLVVGSPRSGTQFFAKMLQNFGMRVNHERMGEDGIVNSAWLIPEDPSFSDPGRVNYSFDKIIHLVRHPLQVIDSISREGESFGPFWEIQERHTGLKILDFTDMEAIAEFWLHWTRGCHQMADMYIRLEDVQHLGDKVHEGPNADKRMKLEWSDVGEAEKALRKQAARFKYG